VVVIAVVARIRVSEPCPVETRQRTLPTVVLTEDIRSGHLRAASLVRGTDEDIFLGP
jgi:hypothetical protein